MGEVLSKGTLFPSECVSEVFSAVRGKSSLAALCDQMPVSFTGNDLFVFNMDKEGNLARILAGDNIGTVLHD